MTIETLTYEAITEKLDAAGVDYEHHDRGTDREVLSIPGYGEVWYDDGSTSGNPGWVAADQPIEEARLLDELAELIEMVEAIKPPALSEDAIRELCVLTTRDEAGRHFSETSDHWESLEDAGMITVHRPVHEATGIPYGQEHWSLEVTEAGQDLVDANEELHPEGE